MFADLRWKGKVFAPGRKMEVAPSYRISGFTSWKLQRVTKLVSVCWSHPHPGGCSPLAAVPHSALSPRSRQISSSSPDTRRPSLTKGEEPHDFVTSIINWKCLDFVLETTQFHFTYFIHVFKASLYLFRILSCSERCKQDDFYPYLSNFLYCIFLDWSLQRKVNVHPWTFFYLRTHLQKVH